MIKQRTARQNTLWICVTGLFMALNVAFSSFGVPVPGGHFYLTDIVVCTAAMLLDPLGAFFAGGVGALIGDMIFYPPAMFVSLVVHGVQAVVISLFANKAPKKRQPLFCAIGVTVGAVIMVVGYTLGKAFVYSTPEYAVVKLPYEILQAAVGAVAGMVLVWRFGLGDVYARMIKR